MRIRLAICLACATGALGFASLAAGAKRAPAEPRPLTVASASLTQSAQNIVFKVRMTSAFSTVDLNARANRCACCSKALGAA